MKKTKIVILLVLPATNISTDITNNETVIIENTFPKGRNIKPKVNTWKRRYV